VAGFNTAKRARRNYAEALNTTRMMGWGIGSWEACGGPTRNSVMSQVSRALKVNGMRIDGGRLDHNARPLFKLYQNQARRNSVILEGSFESCCRRAVELIDLLP
jgi:hypothetical protein